MDLVEFVEDRAGLPYAFGLPKCRGNRGYNDPNGRGRTCDQCEGSGWIDPISPLLETLVVGLEEALKR